MGVVLEAEDMVSGEEGGFGIGLEAVDACKVLRWIGSGRGVGF